MRADTRAALRCAWFEARRGVAKLCAPHCAAAARRSVFSGRQQRRRVALRVMRRRRSATRDRQRC
jgi:hypothetical protein